MSAEMIKLASISKALNRSNCWVTSGGVITIEDDDGDLDNFVYSWHEEVGQEICENKGIEYTYPVSDFLIGLGWIKGHVPGWCLHSYILMGKKTPNRKQLDALVANKLLRQSEVDGVIEQME